MNSKLHLYGQFRWEFEDNRFAPKLREKTEALIAYVALSPNGVATRVQLAALLWEDGKDPLASVRQSIREVRELEHSFGSDAFSVDGNYISLDMNKVWVDCRTAAELHNKFSMENAATLSSVNSGVLLEGCPITSEAFLDWLTLERSKAEGDLVQCYENLLDEISIDVEDPKTLKKVASNFLKVDRSNEKAHRALMRAYSLDDERASALKQYRNCVAVLRDMFGVEPSKETVALAREIENGPKEDEAETNLRPLDLLIKSDEDLRATVIVKPFASSVNDTVLDFISQSFRTDIIEQLSRISRFSVKENNDLIITDIENIGTDPLTPVYEVKGNVVNVADTTTILLQLVENVSGDILWMKRISPEIQALMSHSDEQALFAAIEISRMIEQKETEIALKSEDSLLNARYCVLKAISIMFRFSEASCEEAKKYLIRALELNPDYSDAIAWLAFLKSIELGQGYANNPEEIRDEIGVLVRRSIELSPGNDIGLAIAGHLEAFVHHDFETAHEYFERSLSANANCAFTWGFSAITNCYVGKPTKALEQLNRCRQIMPFDAHPYYFDTARCIASMLSGRYEDAVRIGRQVLRNNPNFHANYRPLISSLGHLGRIDEAAPVMAEFEKFNPDFSIDWHLENYPPLEEEFTEKYLSGLRLAGVSEH